jgi:uracil-DNA glycosylase
LKHILLKSDRYERSVHKQAELCFTIVEMELLKDIRSCNICQDSLPLIAKPILQFSKQSKLLLIGQAPGIKAHNTNRPWNDASGIRLREWLKIDESDFYCAKKTAIVPMGFCYPGRGASGDNPPRPECSARWMDSILHYLKNIELKILIGSYAANHFLGKGDLTSKIRLHSTSNSPYIVLPHPSPRNNIWLSKNAWFLNEILPLIRFKITSSLSS